MLFLHLKALESFESHLKVKMISTTLVTKLKVEKCLAYLQVRLQIAGTTPNYNKMAEKPNQPNKFSRKKYVQKNKKEKKPKISMRAIQIKLQD
jgi:hypothetical protein